MLTRLCIVFGTAAAVFGLACCDGDAKTAKVGPNLGQILSELHDAKHLLDHANHTYNGHRAKADHEINHAIHILHHEHHKHHGTHYTHKHHHKLEPNSVSDAQLRMAEKLVHAALHQLHAHPGHKAHEAAKFLHQAAREIELALHVHHKHHAKKT